MCSLTFNLGRHNPTFITFEVNSVHNICGGGLFFFFLEKLMTIIETITAINIATIE